MPNPQRRDEAPHFTGESNDSIAYFLFEYDTLATGCGLSDCEKVKTIVHYIEHHIRDLWKSLNGYSTGDWETFKSTLESLYPDTSADTRYTKRALQDFVDISAKTRMRDEDDVMTYYRHFLTLSNPLLNKQRITDNERNVEFFQGFHPDDRKLLTLRLFAMKPDHPEPYDLEDVVTAARRQFSGLQLCDFLSREFRGDLRESRHVGPNQMMRRLLGREDRDPGPSLQDCESHCGPDSMDDRDSWSNYELHLRRDLPRDGETRVDHSSDHGARLGQVLDTQGPMFRVSSIVEYRAPSSQLWPQPATSAHRPQSAASLITERDDGSSYFRPMLRTKGCVFCADPGHHVRQCSIAKDYVQTNRTVVINDRLHLPNGQPIPNDGNGRGLKPAIDKWLAPPTL